MKRLWGDKFAIVKTTLKVHLFIVSIFSFTLSTIKTVSDFTQSRTLGYGMDYVSHIFLYQLEPRIFLHTELRSTRYVGILFLPLNNAINWTQLDKRASLGGSRYFKCR